MNRYSGIRCFWLAWLIIAPLPLRAVDPDGAGRDALAAKQQIVRDRMHQLEDRMFRLAEKLRETEPDKAERMQQALAAAREKLIARQMEEVSALLDEGRLTEAGDRQLAIITSLEAVLDGLLEDPDRTEALQDEIDRLRAFEKRVDEILDEQRALRARNMDAIAEKDSDTGESASNEGRPSEAAEPSPADQKPASKEESQESASTRPAATQPQTDSQAQRDLQQQTDQLAEEMQADDASSEPVDDPAESSPPSPESARGAQRVQQAGEHMQKAARQLEQQQRPPAMQQQDEAIKQLEQAREELAETLDQLRREQQEEILRGLESRFRAMLAQQIKINEGTTQLDAKGRDDWTHEDRLAVAGLAHEEQGLVEEAAQALHILREDGTTIVFPRIVAQLRDDLQHVADRLSLQDTGTVTQQLEADVVVTLEELVESVQTLRRELQSQPRQSPPTAGRPRTPPLLPTSAELKLLRAGQSRINRQTKQAHGQMARDQDSASSRSADWSDRLEAIADRQEELADMARKMNERITGQ